MAVVGEAPCQCFSPGGHQTTSPGRIVRALPALALHQAAASGHDQVLPEGMRVPRRARAGLERDAVDERPRRLDGRNRGSRRTAPLNVSAGPFAEGREPLRWISMCGHPYSAPNRSNRYASSGPPFSLVRELARRAARTARCSGRSGKGPASTGSKPASRMSSAATALRARVVARSRRGSVGGPGAWTSKTPKSTSLGHRVERADDPRLREPSRRAASAPEIVWPTDELGVVRVHRKRAGHDRPCPTDRPPASTRRRPGPVHGEQKRVRLLGGLRGRARARVPAGFAGEPLQLLARCARS